MDPVDAMKNAQQLDNSSAPDAADSACQEVACLLQPKRATQTTGEILARFDPLHRKTGSKMQTKRGFPWDRCFGDVSAGCPPPSRRNRCCCLAYKDIREFMRLPGKHVAFPDRAAARVDRMPWRPRVWM